MKLEHYIYILIIAAFFASWVLDVVKIKRGSG
jgi:hypothetical protein